MFDRWIPIPYTVFSAKTFGDIRAALAYLINPRPTIRRVFVPRAHVVHHNKHSPMGIVSATITLPYSVSQLIVRFLPNHAVREPVD